MIEQMETLIAQLQHAVTTHNGKTTLTQADIDQMSAVLRQLKRYDQMAAMRR